jgi:hypothetical protein
MPGNIANGRSPSGNDGPWFQRTIGISTDWEERVVTAVATTVAIMVVAAVAILMGLV